VKLVEVTVKFMACSSIGLARANHRALRR